MRAFEGALVEESENPTLGELASGETVYDGPNGHLHHSVENIIGEVLARVDSHDRNFIEDEVNIDEELPAHRVEVDPLRDDLFLAQREGRAGLSVFVRNKAVGKTDKITVIAVKNIPDQRRPERPQDGYTLITAYVGSKAPREPWDPWFRNSTGEETPKEKAMLRGEALRFWVAHAFVPDPVEFPIVPGSETEFDPEKIIKTL